MTSCPCCETEVDVIGARYCYVCGSPLHPAGKPHTEEPTFVLHASDLMAPMLIRLWAAQKWQENNSPEAVADARACAAAMEAWRKAYGP